jgi:hypothetical protein
MHKEWEELSKYLGGLDPSVMQDPQSAIADEFRELGEERFYRESKLYLYDHIDYSVSGVKNPFRELILFYIRTLEIKKPHMGFDILDFGCGGGSDGIHFAQDFDVAFYDFRNPSTEFLRWRLRHRHLNAHIWDMGSRIGPAEKSCSVVASFGVVEHVQGLDQQMRLIRQMVSFATDLVAIDVSLGGASKRWPMHYRVDWLAIEGWIREEFKVLSLVTYENCDPYPEGRFLIFRV